MSLDSVARHADRAAISRADGSHVLDFESGGLGHGSARVTSAVAAQMKLNPLATRHFLSLPLARFAATLAARCPSGLEVSYLCNSGAEAVEGALKLAHGARRNRAGFVALVNSYHGSTLGALSVCGIEGLRAPLTQLLFETSFAVSPDEIASSVDRGTAAAIVEPWPGGCGLPGASAGWLKRLARRCEETGSLLIADETRSGLGRTGSMFAVEHERVVPDILVLGGSLGGGVLPVAGYVVGRRLNDRVYGRRDPTLHASATGGNPVACAAGLAALEEIEDEQLADAARAMGRSMRSTLGRLARRHPSVIASSGGIGLFARAGFRRKGQARTVVEKALRRGLALRLPAESASVEICPPMRVSEGELEEGLAIFAEAVRAVGAPESTR